MTSGTGGRRARFFERIWDVISSWGGPEAVKLPATRPQPGRELRVLLEHHGRRIHVGSLAKQEDEYVFEYAPEFKDQRELSPISAFRDLSTEHRSKELWPFFTVRVPPLEREDVRRLLETRGVDPNDEFKLLATVGARTITSPYELELVERRTSRPSGSPALAHV